MSKKNGLLEDSNVMIYERNFKLKIVRRRNSNSICKQASRQALQCW